MEIGFKTNIQVKIRLQKSHLQHVFYTLYFFLNYFEEV